jgi:hypothetical protein
MPGEVQAAMDRARQSTPDRQIRTSGRAGLGERRGSRVLNRRQRDYVQALATVNAEDAHSLAGAEALIAAAAADGLVTHEVTRAIGLARWLPNGHPDRARLMARAQDRSEETGFRGVAHLLDR